MPTYQYACDACGEKFEVVQSFTDSTLTTHTTGCGGPAHKRFGGIAVAFKGTGFYRNDSRENGGVPAAKSESGESKGDAKSESKGDSTSAGKSETKTESKPAATPATTSPAPSKASSSSSSTPAS